MMKLYKDVKTMADVKVVVTMYDILKRARAVAEKIKQTEWLGALIKRFLDKQQSPRKRAGVTDERFF